MNKTYTLHFELTDGTLDEAFWSCGSKALALKVAKNNTFSASPNESGIARLVVCKGEMTVATYENTTK